MPIQRNESCCTKVIRHPQSGEEIRLIPLKSSDFPPPNGVGARVVLLKKQNERDKSVRGRGMFVSIFSICSR